MNGLRKYDVFATTNVNIFSEMGAFRPGMSALEGGAYMAAQQSLAERDGTEGEDSAATIRQHTG